MKSLLSPYFRTNPSFINIYLFYDEYLRLYDRVEPCQFYEYTPRDFCDYHGNFSIPLRSRVPNKTIFNVIETKNSFYFSTNYFYRLLFI